MSADKAGSGIPRRTIVIAFAAVVAVAIAVIGAALYLASDDDRSSGNSAAVDLSGIDQNGMFLGDPGAEVLLIEYADIQCPFCAQYSNGVFPVIVDEYIRPGKVRSEYRGLAFLPGPSSERGLRFVLAAGLQNHGWDLQEALFRNQGEEGTAWVTDELVRELASEIDGLDVDKMFEDADSAEVTSQIQEMARQGQADQVPGTPTFFVQIGDGEPYLIQVPLSPDAFRAALDDALQG